MSRSYHVSKRELKDLTSEELVDQSKDPDSRFAEYIEKKGTKKVAKRLRKDKKDHTKTFGEDDVDFQEFSSKRLDLNHFLKMNDE